ncbi:hypothetical protein [Salipaludibacillus sp. CF4.18]|uniref:hypothetical protein n=1 Tax=Salipaludibacillus sp. CF4.18 TaxID=3373081 RepID=UPI003EE7549D
MRHLLEPLTSDEIMEDVAIVREKKNLTEDARFVQVVLREPLKETVLPFRDGDPVNREASIVILDNVSEQTYEVAISITHKEVISFITLESSIAKLCLVQKYLI